VQFIHNVDHATGMNQAHGKLFEIGRNAIQLGFAADDGKRLAIDFLAIADVINHCGLSL